MSFNFQDVCDVTRKVAKESPGDLRAWLYILLMSPTVRTLLLDETMPDRTSQARLSRRSPLAEQVVAEFSDLSRPTDFDAIDAVVKILDSLVDVSHRIMDLEPKVVAAAEREIRGGYDALCNLYRTLVGFPKFSIEERIQWVEKQRPELARKLRASHETLVELREAMKEHGIEADHVMPDIKPIVE